MAELSTTSRESTHHRYCYRLWWIIPMGLPRSIFGPLLHQSRTYTVQYAFHTTHPRPCRARMEVVSVVRSSLTPHHVTSAATGSSAGRALSSAVVSGQQPLRVSGAGSIAEGDVPRVLWVAPVPSATTHVAAQNDSRRATIRAAPAAVEPSAPSPMCGGSRPPHFAVRSNSRAQRRPC